MSARQPLFCLLLFLAIPSIFYARLRPLPPSDVPLTLREAQSNGRPGGNPFDDYLNFRVNSDVSGMVQNEEQACISPLDSNVFVAVWRDFRLGYRQVGVGYSHDSGETWSDTLFPPMYEIWQSDPTLVVDGDGIFTANVITYDGQYTSSHLLQVSSYDDGVTWQDSVWAARFLMPAAFEDKQMLAVDVSDSEYRGTFYCAWTRFYNYPFTDSLHIVVNYKRPGAAYTVPVNLTPSQGSVQWANVCTGPDGEAYVSWLWWDPQTQGSYLRISRSLNGGVTWSPEATVTPVGFFSAYVDPELLIFSYGAMACDHSDGPFRGRLYMVFTDATNVEVETDVWLIYSDNGGVTWSPRQTICDEPQGFPVDQFHPWISLDEAGRVWVVFYDRRNDPQNLLMDVYFTVSTDGGTTWRANERISTESSDPGAGTITAGLIGEYIGWQARNGRALAAWTDTRLGDQDVFSALVDSVFVEPPSATSPGSAPVPERLSIAAYPNPANNSSTLRLTLAASSAARLLLYDVTGRLAREVELGSLVPGEHRISVDLDGLATGIYVAELRAGQQAARTKLVLLK